MKKLLLLILLTLSSSANHISWLGDYKTALSQAKKEKKDIMVLLVKKECQPCNQSIIKNFMNRDYIDELNQNYISVIVTYEGRISYPIELFYSTVFPILFFVKSEDESFLRKPMYGEEIDEFFDKRDNAVGSLRQKN